MKKTFVSVMAMLLAMLMIFSFASCGTKDGETATSPEKATQAGSESGTEAETDEKIEVTPFEGEFTYKDAVSVMPTNWNVHTYQSTDDAYPIDFIAVGLYGFFFNDDVHPVEGKENYKGYVILPEMAESEPVDVTEQVKKDHPEFNIPESATKGFAYTIDLNKNAVWQDGTPINADTYVYSMQKLLDPKLNNYRAADYYDQNLSIAGAKAYFNQGSTIYSAIGVTSTQFFENGGKIEDLYVDVAGWWGIPNPNGNEEDPYYVSVMDETLLRDPTVPEGQDGDYISAKEIYESTLAPGAVYEDNSGEFLFSIETFEDGVSYDTVGLYKSGEYQITLVLDRSLTGFYLLYSLSSNWIVHPDLYESCLSKVGDTDAWTSSYGTSAETTMSYGPYKMVSYQADKSMRFERNETWYGYTDGKHIYRDPEDGNYYNMYQTTAIYTQYVPEAATRKMMFLKGELMGYGLQAEDYDQYRNSDYCYVTPAETVFFFIFNGNMDAIKNREANEGFDQSKYDLETLTLKSFRQAMAVTYDKDALCTAVSPSRSGAFGLIGSSYIYDPETGAQYRDTDVAKQALCDFYSVDVSKFDSLDDAVDSITGYDPVKAKELFTKAYNEALAEGYITDTDKDGKSDQTIEIEYANAETSTFIEKTLDYLNQKLAEVLVGTPFEGKISFKLGAPVGSNAWSDNIKNGISDTVLAGWQGSALDPFGLTDLYANPAKAYDAKWFDANTVTMTLTIPVDGVDTELTMTLMQWSNALNGETVTVGGKEYNFGDGIAEVETRLAILAKFETTILQTYNYLPMLQDGGMALLSQQVYYVVEEYNVILGRGGIAYMKYNYDDAAWTKYVDSQPDGQISY